MLSVVSSCLFISSVGGAEICNPPEIGAELSRLFRVVDLKKIKADSIVWRNWMSGYPANPATDVTYLKSSFQALQGWVERKQNSFKTYSAFKKAMNEMQLTSSQYFRLEGIDEVERSISDFKFGHTRNSQFISKKTQPTSITFPQNQPESFSGQLSKQLRDEYLVSGFTSETKNGSMRARKFKGRVIQLKVGERSYPVQLEKIEYFGEKVEAEIKRNFPYRKMKTLSLTLEGSSSSAHMFYDLVPATEVDGLLRSAFLDFQRIEKLSVRSPRAALDAMADYYQTLVVAHPYTRVNNSVFMNQVNEMLVSLGRHPVFHRDLDFWAFGLEKKVFRRFFVDYINDSTNWAI